MLNVLRVLCRDTFGLIVVLVAFFLFDVFGAFYLLDVFSALFLLGLTMVFGLETVFGLRFGLTLIVLSIIFGDFVVLLAELSLVFESFCVPQGVETVVS